MSAHLYPVNIDASSWSAKDFYNETILNRSYKFARFLRRSVDESLGSGVPVWISEGSPNWKVRGPVSYNLTFELAYVDMLGSFAAGGVSLFARQCLSSALGPGYVNPAFWVAIFWRRIMGRGVLPIDIDCDGVRAYGHVALGSPGGTVGLVVLNLRQNETLEIPVSYPATCLAQEEYHFTPGTPESGSTVLINGVAPRFASSTATALPPLPPKVGQCGSLQLQPRSFAFVAVRLQMGTVL